MPMIGFQKFFLTPALIVLCSTAIAQSSGPAPIPRDPKEPVLRATAPIEIIGTVVAHDERGGLTFGLVDVDTYLDCLVIRVEKILSGHISGNYVRADFTGGGSNNLPKSLFEGGRWIMKLNPSTSEFYHSCDWTIRPNPSSGDPARDFMWIWRLVPVGGAKNFPDVNSLYCYNLERKNLQETRSNPQR
jgi:hypothetical protein